MRKGSRGETRELMVFIGQLLICHGKLLIMAPGFGTLTVPAHADEEMEALEAQAQHVSPKHGVMPGIKFVLSGSRAHICAQYNCLVFPC